MKLNNIKANDIIYRRFYNEIQEGKVIKISNMSDGEPCIFTSFRAFPYLEKDIGETIFMNKESINDK